MPSDNVSEKSNRELGRDREGTRTLAAEITATLLGVGLLYLMGTLLVPFVLALVLAIALSRPADWLQAKGVPGTLANLVVTVAVAALLAISVGLVAMQAGSILGDADTYFDRFAELLDRASQWSGGDKLMESLGVMDAAAAEGGEGETTEEAQGPEFWKGLLRRNAQVLARWLASGIGGVVGLIGGVVLFLSFLFYMLETRREWVDRVVLAAERLGLRPKHRDVEAVRDEIVRFFGAMTLVSFGYTAVVSTVLWLVGVPQPLLWGLLTGLLEFIPYFGPMIATAMPLLVSLSLGKWWPPAVVIAQFIALHTFEQYVVTPVIYGRAIRMDPVLALFGLLIFGWLWGPLGMVVAMPMLILIRGLVAITPGTSALDAIVDPEPSPQEEATSP